MARDRKRKWREGTILSDYEWEVYRLRHEQKLSWGQIAKKLNTSDSSVAHTYRNSRKKMTAAIKTLRDAGVLAGTITKDQYEMIAARVWDEYLTWSNRNLILDVEKIQS